MRVPLLLRPSLLAIRNRWSGSRDISSQAGRDLFLFFFSIVVMVAVFSFTSWALREANLNPTLALLPPAMLLGVVFVMLLLMLTISAVLSALGTFYLADDLELVLPTPLRWHRIFTAKYVYVVLMSGWMPFLFASPMLLAFGIQYHTHWLYYLYAPLLLILFLMVPAALGIVAATLLVTAIPVYRVRETIMVALIALSLVGYFLIDALSIEWNSLRSAQEMLRVMSLISAPSLHWVPSNWLSASLGELLRPQGVPILWYVIALASSAMAALALAYLMTLVVHARAYSNIRNKRQGASRGSRRVQRFLRLSARYLPAAFRALIGKELRILSRDIGQVVQIFMLIALSLVYLYHMRLFSAVESFPEGIRPWWRNFLFIGNITMGAFVVTAICTRFVVPSVSLEGRSFWILQTSPLELRSIVRLKFLAWLIPTSLIAALFFSAGAIAIGADTPVVVICGLSSIVISYGVVGLAIGLGARFAYFEWEHSSQLAGSMASLLFMLAATMLIFVNMVPAWLLLVYSSRISFHDEGLNLLLALAVLVVTVIWINIEIARLAMHGGVQSLKLKSQ